jgi:hypothetical protein
MILLYNGKKDESYQNIMFCHEMNHIWFPIKGKR